MSNKLEICLEDIAKQLKDEDSKYTTVQSVLDEIYNVGLSASNIASILTGGFTIPDLLKDFKPSEFLKKFMPNQYLNVSKEDASIHRYDKLAISNLSMLLVSFNQAIDENNKEITDVLNQIKIKNVTEKETLEVKDDSYVLSEIENFTKLNYSELLKTKCTLPNISNSKSIDDYIKIMMCTLNNLFDMSSNSKHDDISQKIEESVKKFYYINLLEISSEFPEVKLWIDLEFQKEILKKHQNLATKLEEIRTYQNKDFSNQLSLAELDNLLENNSNIALEKLSYILRDKPILKLIEAHHKFIKDEVNKTLLEENDINELILPTRQEIYIPQSYKHFYYRETEHKKTYLDNNNWSTFGYKEDEDIGKELFHALRNPHNINQPIIILGHPGAGKSMFSSLFSYKLIDNNEFVPFLIKLRSVDSRITDIDAHINHGIGKSIGINTVNWIDWVEKFPDKIPVFVLDGFDELLRASQTQLNDYILQIQKLQKQAQFHNLNIRVILTSRLTIMQDVKIPENSLIIKLNSFDEKRKDLWIQKWNEKQNQKKQFKLPKREDIDDLSKEPLLLFLLAIYDFENNALSKIAEEGLNKSSLYDKLFGEFTKRQLRKDSFYNGQKEDEQKELEDKFRLRIGFFAQMLFLHDRVYHYEIDFDEELKELKLCDDKNKAKNILDGFFFVHKDKSTDGHEKENLSFEFLHKTFGEFLSADFMLRIAKFRAEENEREDLANEQYFRQIFSYQWIYKQPKTLEFLFEYSNTIVDNDNSKALIKFIKKELKALLDDSSSVLLPKALHKLKVFEKLKHTAIYSQNLLLIWVALEKDKFEFYLSHDLDNIQSWKVFVDLWKDYGDYEHVSYLSQYICIKIESEKCIIYKVDKNKEHVDYTNFTNYTKLIGNNEELVLSYYESEFIMQDLEYLYDLSNKKISNMVSNLSVARLDYIYSIDWKNFNDKSFFSLWEKVSYSNKIKLFNFYVNKKIPFNKRRAINEVFIASRDKRILSLKEQLEFIELLFKIEYEPRRIRDMLRELYENFRHRELDRYERSRLSLNEQLRFIELILEVEQDSKMVRDMLRELYSNSRHEQPNRYVRSSLSPSEQLRFIELVLEVERDFDIAKDMLRELYANSRHEQPDRYVRSSLSPSEQLRFIELVLEVEQDSKMVRDMLRELHEDLRVRRQDRYVRSSLSPSEQLRFIELVLEVEQDSEMVRNMLRELHEDFRFRRHDSYMRNSLSPSEQLRCIELGLAIDGNSEMVRDMFRDLYEDFRHSRSDRYKRSRLSLSEQLRFIELVLEVEQNPKIAREIWKSLPTYIKYGNRYLANKIKQLE